MSRDLSLYLTDIINSVDRIKDYTRSMNYDDFVEDRKTYDAVIHNLHIIGEATKQVPEIIRQNYPDIPWRQVAGLRDVIAHTYFMVNPEIVWNILNAELEPLQTTILLILSNETLDL
ncbi:MAG: DUF86 domain-containing protein [Xenococcus sp. (in: cyanobacteria)]